MTVISKISKWKRIHPKGGNSPPKRKACSLDYYDHKLFLLGGYNGVYLNDLWVFNIKTNIWYKLLLKEDIPAMAYHKTVVYHQYIIIYGGLMNSYSCHNNLYVYDIKLQKWGYTRSIYKPIGRYKHSMCIMNKMLIIHGGLNAGESCLDTIYATDINNIIGNNTPSWIKINNINLGALYGHSLFSHNSTLYCFSGDNPEYLFPNNNIIIWNKHMNQHNFIQYYCLTHFGQFPPNIISHIITKYHNTCTFKYILETPTILGRYEYGSCMLSNLISNQSFTIIIFGGCNPETRFKDVIIISKNN